MRCSILQRCRSAGNHRFAAARCCSFLWVKANARPGRAALLGVACRLQHTESTAASAVRRRGAKEKEEKKQMEGRATQMCICGAQQRQ